MWIRQWKSAKEAVTSKACNQLQCKERRNQRFDKENLNKNRRNFDCCRYEWPRKRIIRHIKTTDGISKM